MPNGGPGQRKGGLKECKVCAHPGRKEIDAMLLNVAAGTPIPYNTIIAAAARNHPGAPALSKPNLTNHKNNHLLNQPITREVVDDEGNKVVQTYLTGHYEARSIVIPQEAVPTIPSMSEGLKIIIAAALHNALNNPALVTVKDGLEAMKLLKQLGGGADELETYLGAWGEVETRKKGLTARAKRTRSVTVSEEVEVPVAAPPPSNVVDAEWSEADLDGLALPEGGPDGSA